MKGIFSTSVFGSGPQYVVGAHRQCELAKAFYPGWEFRLYTDRASLFTSLDANVIEITQPGDGCFWRFLPLFESDSHVVIVRDADSRVTAREAMAVSEWLASTHRFHILHDHENHGAEGYAIVASLFGLKGKLGKEVADEMAPYMARPHVYGRDEEFLATSVFPRVKDDCLIHSQGKGWFGLSRRHLRNPYEFVGNGWDEHDLPLYTPSNSIHADRAERTKHRFASYQRTHA